MTESFFVHAITDRGAVWPVKGPPVEGLRGRPVYLIESVSLAAVASISPPEEVASFTRNDLIAHHRAVEAVAETGACLPVRFATWIASKQDVVESLTGRRDELQAALERVRGRKELAVTLLWTDSAAPAAKGAGTRLAEHRHTAGQPATAGQVGTGRRFMEERRRRWTDVERKRERAADWAEHVARGLECLGVSAEDVHSVVCPAPRVALSCSILIHAELAERALERVLHAGRAWPEVRVLAHGAWPPYTFARLAT